MRTLYRSKRLRLAAQRMGAHNHATHSPQATIPPIRPIASAVSSAGSTSGPLSGQSRGMARRAWGTFASFANTQACNNLIQVLAWGVAAATLWFAFLPDIKVKDAERRAAEAQEAYSIANGARRIAQLGAEAARVDLRVTGIERDRMVEELRGMQAAVYSLKAQLTSASSERSSLSDEVAALHAERRLAAEKLQLDRFLSAQFRERRREELISSFNRYIAATCIHGNRNPNLGDCISRIVLRDSAFEVLPPDVRTQLVDLAKLAANRIQVEYAALADAAQLSMTKLQAEHEERCRGPNSGRHDCVGFGPGWQQEAQKLDIYYQRRFFEERLHPVLDRLRGSVGCPKVPDVGPLPADWPKVC